MNFSRPFASPAGSPIRELFPYLSKPGMISFAGGYPSPTLFDAQGLQDAAQRALGDVAGSLQYGATEGAPALRQALAHLCETRGITCDPAQIMVTTGSQQAFDLLTRVLVEPGTSVYIESPAYPATIQALRLAEARITEVPVDADGLDTAKLRHILASVAPSDRPKLLYTVPTFSNPSGVLLSFERRQELVRLAVEYGFLIIEDDPYGELKFDSSAVPTVYSVGQKIAGEANPVVYLSSVSKTVAPALRIGWMLCAPEIQRRCAIAKQTSDLCTSPLNQAVAAHYLAGGRYAATVDRAREEYGRRMRAMVQGLRDELGSQVAINEPRGGMFLWVELAEQVDMARLFQAAVDEGVLYVPGKAFFTGDVSAQSMRLSFATPTVEQIGEGCARLARAVRLSRLSVPAA